MNQRRIAAAALFSLVMAAVLALIIYTERSNASQTLAVWILAHDVVAGAPYAAADVQQVQIRAQGGDFSYEERGPGAYPARYARSLSAHDIVRADDLMPLSTQSEIGLTVLNAPPLSTGDRVDVFAALPSGQQALVGHDLTVHTVNGNSLTVLVPSADEAPWIAVSSSNIALHIARSVSGAPAGSGPIDADEAIHILCGTACATPVPTAASASP
jgi:hypothetical protein